MTMFNADTELLFPIRVIPTLQNMRGEEWQSLVEKVSSQSADVLDVVAFSAMLIKLGGCANCNVDSFRAMRGCTECARLTLRRYKNLDHDLIQLFESARCDVEDFLAKKENSKIEEKANAKSA